MSFARKTFASAFVLAAFAAAAALPAAADPGAGDNQGHGPMMLAQADSGPEGSKQGGPGTMRGDGKGAAAGTESRHERHMRRFAERRIALLDTDGDGKISRDEITAEHKRLFGAADVNSDGKLSADEFRRRGRWFVRMGTTSFFDMLDADGDGQLTAEEINAPSERWFERHDVNNTGTLDAEQYLDARGRGRHGRHR